MNQMLKKASTTCAAFACAASLMFSGAAVVWADGEIDETVKNQIETYAEGLTDEIIGLSDDQIEQYMESDDAFTSSAMTAWDGTKDDLGELKETGDVEIEYSGDEYTAVIPVEFEKEDAEFTYVFDKNLTPTSLAVDIQYSFGTTMKNAALNTLMGIGTVFVILAMLIFLISLFKYIPGSGAQQVKKKKEEAEIKNNATSLIGSAERIVKDFEGKIDEADKKKLDEQKEALQKAIDENKSSDELKKLSDELQQTMFSISQKAYEAVQKEDASAQSASSENAQSESAKNDDDVIDAEYTKE